MASVTDVVVATWPGACWGCAEGEGEEDEEDAEEEEEEEDTLFKFKVAKLNEADNVVLFTSTVLNMLQHMCEGHFEPLQLLLQAQSNSSSSVDLIVVLVELLNVLQVQGREAGLG